MRRLMWFTIGFAAACGLRVWVLPETWMLPEMLILIGCIIAFPFDRKFVFCRAAGIVCLGAVLGFGWFSGFSRHYLDRLMPLHETEQSICIEASDYSFDTGYGIGVDGKVSLGGKTYRIRAYINEQTELKPGDTVTGTFRLRVSVPTEESDGTYHAGMGVFLLAYQDSEIAVSAAQELSARHYPAVLSRKIGETLRSCFPEDTAAFAKALLLGDIKDLNYELDTALKISGIRHVVAVSGLHVAILFCLIQMVTLKNPILTALLGMPVLLLFASLAGFTPSVSRACMMCSLMILGRILDREYDGLTSLSFAALIMLMLNPWAVTSVSMQLSVASVAGIFLFYHPINGWLLGKYADAKGKKLSLKIRKWITMSVSVTISAMVLTTPLSALYFGVVSLIGILTNLLTLWAVSVIFYSILAVCGMNLFWHGGAVILAEAVSYLIRYVLLCAEVLGKFPLAAVYTRSVYITVWLIFAYCLITAFLLQRKKHPAVLAGCLVVSLFLSVLLSWAEPMTASVQMTVLDVGQGQSILLQSEGRTYIVDCGGDNDEETADRIAETLLSQGIVHVDGIIVTHMDRDHAGALPYLLSRVDVDCLIVPDTEEPFTAPDPKVSAVVVKKDLKLAFGSTKIQIYGSGYRGNGNENSLCVLFEHENCAILITGDRSELGEKLLLRKADLPKVDVLIAGHHGAEDSTSEELLRKVKPETVIISAGKDNIYGHPSGATLERLKRFGCEVLRTDKMGTITYRR